MTSDMPAPEPTPWRRLALWTFLAGVGVNALIAIVVILGVGGDAEWRILGTSLLLTAASIAVIANAAVFDRRVLGPVPLVAGAAAAVATAMGIWAIWSEEGGDHFFQWMATVTVLSIAGTYSGLISLPPLSSRHRWLQWGAAGLAGLLALLLIAGIWDEDTISGELWGVLAVLLASATIVVPVLARAGRSDEGGGQPAALVSFCPVCGTPIAPTARRDLECSACSASFAVTIRRPGATGTTEVTPG